MLESVEITNYQSHRSTSINFCKGMNVITGVSDAGKSAVFRALLWAINNRPSGEAFKSWAAGKQDEVSVAMQFDNDWYIKKRIKAKNMYESEAGTFEALRTDVPESIQAISNITDYNIQTQFQPYFMLQNTPGERAKKINELVGLDIIDRVLSKLNSRISSAKSSVVRLKQEVSEGEEAIQNLAHLDSVSTQIADIETHINKHAVDTHRQDLLASLADKLDEINDQIAKAETILKAETPYLKLSCMFDRMQELQSRMAKVILNKVNLSLKSESIESENTFLEIEPEFLQLQTKMYVYPHKAASLSVLEKLRRTLDAVSKNIDIDKEYLLVEEVATSIKLQTEEYQSFKNDRDDLQKMVNMLGKLDYNLHLAEEEVKTKRNVYVSILDKVRICPTCFSELSPEQLLNMEV